MTALNVRATMQKPDVYNFTFGSRLIFFASSI